DAGRRVALHVGERLGSRRRGGESVPLRISDEQCEGFSHVPVILDEEDSSACGHGSTLAAGERGSRGEGGEASARPGGLGPSRRGTNVTSVENLTTGQVFGAFRSSDPP